MTKFFSALFFLLFSFSTLHAQVVIIDEDFEDQDITQNPEWSGDLGNFSFFDDNGNILLRLNDDSDDRSQLITSSSTVYGSWEFYIEVPATSSFNRVYMYLISDEDELDIIGSGSPSSASGYAIHTGGGHFDLVRIRNGSEDETLLSSNTEIEDGTGYQVQVTRSDDGYWELYVSEGYGSTPTLDSGMVNDNTFTESNYFGFLARYSSGNRENFFFDDIIITNTENFDAISAETSSATSLDITFNYPIDETSLSTSGFQVDQSIGAPSSVSLESDFVVRLQFSNSFEDGDYTVTINDVETDFGEVIEPNTQLDFSIQNPFTSTGTETISNSEIDLFFTEEVDDTFVDLANFEIAGEGNPDQVTQPEPGTIRLEFTTPLPSGEYSLSTSNIQSINGWSLVGDDTFDLFIFDEFEEGDLIISEFFYRVPVDWRTDEFDRPRYVELFNLSDKFLNLRDFTFNGETISSSDLPISPNEYLAVTQGEPIFVGRFGERNFFEAENFPSLSLTTENQIVVRSDNAVTVDSLFYQSSLWGGNERSLERKSFNASSIFSDNWGESEDALLGSPGLSNTVAIPTDSPEVTEVTFPVPRELRVEFSRALSPESVQDLSNFGLTNSAVFESTEYNIEDRKILIFTIDENLLDQNDYSFIYENVDDIFGNNTSGTQEFNFRFLNPFRVLNGNVEDENDVLVQFTQPLNVSTVSISDFQLSDGTSPISIDFPNSENVRLSFPEEFEIGSYTLLINDLESIVGWTIESNTELEFFVFDEYESGDIVINEFMYNTPDGYSRYVEVLNTSNKILNIRDWELRRRDSISNNGGVITASNLAIQPNEFLVIAADSSATNAIFGAGTSIEMSGFPPFRTTDFEDIRLISSSGETADSLRYNPSNWGGNGVALERRRTDIDAFYSQNWAESPNELLGTAGNTNEVDDFEFSLDIERNSSTELTLIFNLEVNQTDAISDNFSLDGQSPSEVTIISPDSLSLEFADPLPSGQTQLTTGQIRSIAGWEIQEGSEFSVFLFDDYEPGDIVINEFMYNTPEGYSKYVELLNTTDKILDLRDWELRRAEGATNNGGVISSTTFGIEPNGFAVIAEDTSRMTEKFGSGNWHQMNSFPGITQTQDDEIRLFDSNGNIADSLRYVRSEWGGTDVALERRSVNVATHFAENWGESPNERFGTPGLPNEVAQDLTPPLWESLDTVGNEAFALRFNERLDEETVTQIDNYSIEPSLGISTIRLNRNVVEITFDDELQSGTEYVVTINEIADLFGNKIESQTRSIEFLRFDEAEPQQVVINEILYRRLQAGSPEFVEIYNQSEQNIDLSEWTLSNASGSTMIPAGTTIKADDYLVFTDTESFSANSEKIHYLSGFQSLSNNGDAVVLKNSVETVIDSLFYLPTWGDNTPGISLERRDPATISIDRSNWTPSSAESGSTPAAENSRFERDVTSPEIIFANLFHPDSLEVRFSEFIDINQSVPKTRIGETSRQLNRPLAQPQLIASNEKSQIRFLVNSEEAELLFYDPNRGDRIILSSENVIPGEDISVSIENFTDFQGNFTSTQEQPIAQPVQPGDLVFNEIMYDPIRDNREGLTNQSEYIEIVNRRPYAISVEGIFLHDRPDNNDEITAIRPVSSTSKWIPANGVLLFHADDRTNVFSDSYTSIFFDLDAELEKNSLRINRSTLSLSLSGREVYLADSTRTTIDRVDYRPEWHNPNLIDTRGKSLERVSPDGDTNDPANWSTNAQPIGGTPATQNSIFQQSPGPLTESGISIDPNPFSPDGDGFDDNLFINYKFDEPDYLMRIRIYDRYGRLVRTLVDAHQAGFEGSVIWDGLTDDGQSNRIGIYIIYVEAYNSATGKNRNFRETAVLARQF